MSYNLTLQPTEAYQTYRITSQKGFVICSEEYISKQSISTITKILGAWKELEIAQENMKEREPKFQQYVAWQDPAKWEDIQEYQYYKRAQERLTTAEASYNQTLAAHRVTSISTF